MWFEWRYEDGVKYVDSVHIRGDTTVIVTKKIDAEGNETITNFQHKIKRVRRSKVEMDALMEEAMKEFMLLKQSELERQQQSE